MKYRSHPFSLLLCITLARTLSFIILEIGQGNKEEEEKIFGGWVR